MPSQVKKNLASLFATNVTKLCFRFLTRFLTATLLFHLFGSLVYAEDTTLNLNARRVKEAARAKELFI